MELLEESQVVGGTEREDGESTKLESSYLSQCSLLEWFSG